MPYSQLDFGGDDIMAFHTHPPAQRAKIKDRIKKKVLKRKKIVRRKRLR